jgi:hypothetical protein
MREKGFKIKMNYKNEKHGVEETLKQEKKDERVVFNKNNKEKNPLKCFRIFCFHKNYYGIWLRFFLRKANGKIKMLA